MYKVSEELLKKCLRQTEAHVELMILTMFQNKNAKPSTKTRRIQNAEKLIHELRSYLG